MKYHKSEKKNLKINAGFNREPMELLQGRSDVNSRGSSCDDTRSCILDQLEFMSFSERSEEDHGGENYSSPDGM